MKRKKALKKGKKLSGTKTLYQTGGSGHDGVTS